jgi:hypothetical protein
VGYSSKHPGIIAYLFIFCPQPYLSRNINTLIQFPFQKQLFHEQNTMLGDIIDVFISTVNGLPDINVKIHG